jgi:hypothetical protein
MLSLTYQHFDQQIITEYGGEGHVFIDIYYPYFDTYEYYYDEKGNDTLYIYKRFWEPRCDTEGGLDDFILQKRQRYDYDDYGNLIRIFSFQRRRIWDVHAGNLIWQTDADSSMKVFSYDESGIQLTESKFEWNDMKNAWQGIYMWEDIYNSNNQKLCHTDYSWDSTGNSWKIIHRDIYQHSKHQVVVKSLSFPEKIHFQVFPNPSDGIINIETTEQTKCCLEVYSVTGQKVHSSLIKNGRSCVDLSALPSGYYFLVLVVKNNKYTNPLIIK